MKFIYITKPLPVFNKKFRENSGNPSSMFIYKKKTVIKKNCVFCTPRFLAKRCDLLFLNAASVHN